MDITNLIEKAIEAKENAYVPYSNFRVGAALLTKSGKIYTGCNIENVSYGATNCAERTAVFKAVSEGEKEFQAIAINGDNGDYLPPCGICRQVLSEFADDSLKVILANSAEDYKVISLGELLPGAFSSKNLNCVTT
ncbi:cytidine deaminase [Roseburia sp. 499]|uniref:cytidine deaminase n=1 Tax=Roseburia sp. 499 TaxID=1261634 RepID=UPI000951C09F|nr:cytidine deaminase [Roseburia sp. 499]WVK71515.1 cytidine deaminase [Roseburia sp. 499]